MLRELSLTTIREARRRIQPWVLRTPVLHHRLDADCELLLKPESLQSTGAFKIRGAFNLMLTLPKGCAGVVAHSSGNHAQAVARAANLLGLRADEIARSEGLVPVPPYDHPLVAAGQGTAALELLEDADLLDRFYAPVSGGGLMAGCAVAIHALSPATEIVAVEPADGNDTKLSLAAGERGSVPPPRTIADGLRVRRPGELTFPVLQRHVARVELVSDEELLDAMVFALREGRGRSGVLLSGGDPQPEHLELAARRAALAPDRRRMRSSRP